MSGIIFDVVGSFLVNNSSIIVNDSSIVIFMFIFFLDFIGRKNFRIVKVDMSI